MYIIMSLWYAWFVESIGATNYKNTFISFWTNTTARSNLPSRCESFKEFKMVCKHKLAQGATTSSNNDFSLSSVYCFDKECVREPFVTCILKAEIELFKMSLHIQLLIMKYEITDDNYIDVLFYNLLLLKYEQSYMFFSKLAVILYRCPIEFRSTTSNESWKRGHTQGFLWRFF